MFQRNAFQLWAFQVSPVPIGDPIPPGDTGGWYVQGTQAVIPGSINVALAANGGVATASSSYSATLYGPSNINNGDVVGGLWGKAGGGWNDATLNVFPDWAQITFDKSHYINQIDVVTLQDNFANQLPVDTNTTFTKYGITAFDVQYWNGSAWINIQSITGNNKVWRQIVFAPIMTSKIRIMCNAGTQYSRLIEVMAWSPTGGISRGRSLVGISRGRISCGY